VAAVRAAVRRSLGDLDPGSVVLVACSGGADSLALAAATAFEARRAGWCAGAVTVDHGLQPGSARRAAEVAAALRRLGLAPVEVATVSVTGRGGPEAAARRARYAALDASAERHGARAVLLGHTRDDQAESVLLGLARGSGARSLSGMSAGGPGTGLYRRPLLTLDRSLTRAACAALDLEVWDDPHNADPAYTRARVRHRVLPVLERELGPGVAGALARTAELLRADADALDAWADRALADARANAPTGSADDGSAPRPVRTGPPAGAAVALDVGRLASLPDAVRWRVVRQAALEAGSPATDLTAGHVAALDALVTDWRGQTRIDLPGKVHAWRREGVLWFAGTTSAAVQPKDRPTPATTPSGDRSTPATTLMVDRPPSRGTRPADPVGRA
jgi:tRNA(Ile)-lysidine synthase